MGRKRAGRKFAIRKATAIAAGKLKFIRTQHRPQHTSIKIIDVRSLCHSWWFGSEIDTPKTDPTRVIRQLPIIISDITFNHHRVYLVLGDHSIRIIGAHTNLDIDAPDPSVPEEDTLSDASTIEAPTE